MTYRVDDSTAPTAVEDELEVQHTGEEGHAVPTKSAPYWRAAGVGVRVTVAGMALALAQLHTLHRTSTTKVSLPWTRISSECPCLSRAGIGLDKM